MNNLCGNYVERDTWHWYAKDIHLCARFRNKLCVRSEEGIAQRAFRIRGIMHALRQILMQMRGAIRRRILTAVTVEHGIVICYRIILQCMALCITCLHN